MFLMTIDVLESAGSRQYEISNYAKPGCECRHNLIYWRNQPYIGVGPSAAGCYFGSDEATKRRSDEAIKMGGRPRRYKNVPDVAEYTRRMAKAKAGEPEGAAESARVLNSAESAAAGPLQLAEIEAEYIEGQTLALEMILMQLRLAEGLSVAAFKESTGLDPLRCFEPNLTRLVEQGLLALTFQDPAHYDLIREDDRISLVGLQDLAPGKPVKCIIKHADGTQDELTLNHSYGKPQIEWFKVGSALNLFHKNGAA